MTEGPLSHFYRVKCCCKEKKALAMKLPSRDHDCLSTILFSARMAGLQEDNKSLKLSLSKVEAERKQAQERSNNLEKVYSKFEF